MFKKSTAGLLALVLAGAAASALAETKVDFDQMNFSVKDIVESVTAEKSDMQLPVSSVSEKVKGAEWTIMVFVNAKNNLEQYGLKDLNEMEMVGSTEKIQVVVELGRIKGYDSSDGDWTGSKRYLVAKDNNTSKISSPVVQTIKKTDMGDYKHLVDFAKWAKTNYPAKRYMLIVWNHGSGWTLQSVTSKGISYDDETGNHITTVQLGAALKEIGKVEIYGSDACLMQMPEVDYEIKDSVDYIVGSEETEPGDGYTYNTFLEKANASDMTPLAVGKAAVNAYTEHYANAGEGATQSLVKASALAGFVQALDAWTEAVIASGDKTAVKNAAKSALSFAYADNKDLNHFVSLVNASISGADAKAKGKALMDYLAAELVKHNKTASSQFADAAGLAIYVPNSYNGNYDELAFAKESKWPAFIKWLAAD